MVARFKRDMELRSFRNYVTDSLHYAPQDMYLAYRWSERNAPKDDRTAEEIADYVIEAAGLEVA